MSVTSLISRYYDAFNRKDWDQMAHLVDPFVVHYPCQGYPRIGQSSFRDFLYEASECYDETVLNLKIDGTGESFWARFIVDGVYKKTAPGQPEAKGQRYLLKVQGRFSIKKNLISEISTHYTIKEWQKSISQGGPYERQIFRGNESQGLLKKLAALRMDVFREPPYLYEGSLDYEESYLSRYTQSKDSVIVALWDKGELIGASTGLPLKDEGDEIRRIYAPLGDPSPWFYFGESVLMQRYRGQGLGHVFFDERERVAYRVPGIKGTTFLSVDRPSNRDLGVFWRARGYCPMDLTGVLSWPDLGHVEATPKSMVVWGSIW